MLFAHEGEGLKFHGHNFYIHVSYYHGIIKSSPEQTCTLLLILFVVQLDKTETVMKLNGENDCILRN